MAAGAIPVFVSGDLDDSSPYVRPFGEAVPWHDISLHFAWEHAGHIVDTLARLSDADVARMQLGVQRAWRRVLSPPTEHRRTLYSLLEKRVGFRFRKRR